MKNKIVELIIWFINRYNIKPQGYCPVQAEGQLPTGEYYYFRSRNTSWSVRIARVEKHLWDIDNDKVWVYSENKYEVHEGGCISKLEAIRNFNKAVKLYYKENKN